MGSVKGLKARGDVTVDIRWKEGELHEAVLWSSNDRNTVARLHYGKEVAAVTVRRGVVYRFGSGLRCLETWPLCK
jgi:alpha-L-fucosidase 2